MLSCTINSSTHSRAVESIQLGIQSVPSDPTSFERVFRQHRDGLQGFLYQRLRSREDAEDAVVLTFFKAWRARDGFRGEIPLKTWLYGIAARVALDVLRYRRSHPTVEVAEPDFGERAGEGGTVPDELDAILDAERRDETRAAIRGAIARLPEDQQRLLNLYYFDGYNYAQISSMLGIPCSRVRGRLYRIRQSMLRDLTTRQHFQPA